VINGSFTGPAGLTDRPRGPVLPAQIINDCTADAGYGKVPEGHFAVLDKGMGGLDKAFKPGRSKFVTIYIRGKFHG
jgi:hypothetical protein